MKQMLKILQLLDTPNIIEYKIVKQSDIPMWNGLDLMSQLGLSWPETSKEPFRHSHPERLVIFITQATPPFIVMGFNEYARAAWVPVACIRE